MIADVKEKEKVPSNLTNLYWFCFFYLEPQPVSSSLSQPVA